MGLQIPMRDRLGMHNHQPRQATTNPWVISCHFRNSALVVAQRCAHGAADEVPGVGRGYRTTIEKGHRHAQWGNDIKGKDRIQQAEPTHKRPAPFPRSHSGQATGAQLPVGTPSGRTDNGFQTRNPVPIGLRQASPNQAVRSTEEQRFGFPYKVE